MIQRREPRYQVNLDVKVWGLDVRGKPFVQHARTVDANQQGARLAGIDCVRQGEILGLQLGERKSRVQVVWVGRRNTGKAGQIGVQSLDPGRPLYPSDARKIPSGPGPQRVIPLAAGLEFMQSPRPVRRSMPEIPSSRRKHMRYHCTGGVEMRRSEGVPAIFGNLSDISLEGCYVETVSTFPAGSEVVFTIKVRDTLIRGRAGVKTSNHAVGMGLEFMHLSTEDQQKLEFLVGTLAGTQDLQPAHKRTVVHEDPLRVPPPLTTRPVPTASMTTPPRRSAPASPAVSAGNSIMSQNIKSTIQNLNNLENDLVKERVDPRLIAQFHDAVEHLRQTTWTLQQWVDLNAAGGDPFEVLPQLEAERMQMLNKLARNVTADIDATTINGYTLGVSELYETIQALYRRLHKMLVDESAG